MFYVPAIASAGSRLESKDIAFLVSSGSMQYGCGYEYIIVHEETECARRENMKYENKHANQHGGTKPVSKERFNSMVDVRKMQKCSAIAVHGLGLFGGRSWIA